MWRERSQSGDMDMEYLLSSARMVVVTLVVCCVIYTGLIWTVGTVLVPDKAQGSLLRDSKGQVIGSSAIAQKFTKPEYFWPRPSAVDYNAAGTGGSNLSPTNPKITERARAIIDQLKPQPGEKVPADLLTASGSGMDPHITHGAAVFQAPRIAAARSTSVEKVKQVIDEAAESPDGLGIADRVVNVLELNIALDKMARHGGLGG
jgi:K+-transporting ATPase ATPase C chain